MAAIFLPNNNNFAFIHVPKSAGSSVVKWLTDNIPGADIMRGHPSLSMMKERWEINESFAIVRNPWSRAISAYFYLLQGKFYWEENGIKSEKDFPSWNEWVLSLTYKTDWWTPLSTNQIEWFSGEPVTVLKAESLDSDFLQIQERLNCFKPVPYINTTDHNDYKSYYTTEQIKHISRIFEKDIDTFKYTF